MRLTLNHSKMSLRLSLAMSLANGLLLINAGPLRNEHITGTEKNDDKNVALQKNDVALQNEYMTCLHKIS